MKSIFISHAVADKPLVDEIVNLIESGIGVPQDDIFCVSQPGNIPSGVDFKQHIKEALDKAKLVMVIITPNFYSSAFSLCELGGVWLRTKNFIPLLVPPFGFTDLRAVLEGVQALKANNATSLDILRDEVIQNVNLQSPSKTPRWNSRRDKFLSSLDEILADLPDNSPVPKADYQKIFDELDEYKSEYSKQEEEISKLKAMIEKLKAIKDSSEVANVIADYSDISDQFSDLVEAAKQTLRALPYAATEALYYYFRHEDYVPEDWSSVKDAMENGYVRENSDENGVRPSDKNAKIRSAIESLSELRDWLLANTDDGSDFDLWYKAEFDEAEPDISLRPFWDKHLFSRRGY